MYIRIFDNAIVSVALIDHCEDSTQEVILLFKRFAESHICAIESFTNTTEYLLL